MDQQLRHYGRRAIHEAPDGWVEPAARTGYAAKGAVYLVLGALSVMAAFEAGRAKGGTGAIQEIGQQPFGQVLLIITGIGLAGYAVWRVVQAVKDTENKGTEAEGLLARVGYCLSGLSHVALAVAAFQLATGGGTGSGGASTWVGQALTTSWGPFAIGALGVFVIGAGLYQLYKSATQKFRDNLKEHEMSSKETSLAVLSGRVGLAARGVVFPIVGYSLVRAALEADPSEAKGVGGALRFLEQLGPIVMACVAAGLVAYGAFQLVLAKYRKIEA